VADSVADMLGRRTTAVLAALVVVATLVTGCQPARAGARCRTTDWGDDGRDWVLQCRNGRWVRALTKQDAAKILLAARPAAATPPTDAAGNPYPNDDYPAQWRNVAQDSVFDSWGYPNRQCTSFVAWRLANTNRATLPVRPGDAGQWDDVLRSHVVVDERPAVGAIAQWNENESFGGLGAGPIGHVAWVQAVHADGSVTVEQYNLGSDGTYVQFRTRAPRYIHVKDL
jgi:surface antigen